MNDEPTNRGSPGASWNPIRIRNREPGKMGSFCVDLFLDEKILAAPLRWRGPRKIFVCSLTDWMADFVPDEWRDRMMAVMASATWHQFLTLTKHAARQRDYLMSLPHTGKPDRITTIASEICWGIRGQRGQAGTVCRPFRNLWAGVSVEDQPRADERIPLLLDTPAAVRWISAELPLEGIDIRKWLPPADPHISWVEWPSDLKVRECPAVGRA
jgi:protein gp37